MSTCLALTTSTLITFSTLLAQVQQVPTEGWKGEDPAPFPKAFPGEAGMSLLLLEEAGRIAQSNQSESLVVVRHGKIVFEEYWGGKKRSDLQQTYSASKSPFTLIVGRAIQKGHIKGLDQPIIELVPEFNCEGCEKVTFRSALAMESGIEQSAEMDRQDSQKGLSQLEAVLARSIVHEPYEWYHYNNAVYRLMFTALENATGMSIPEFTTQELFEPLQMQGAYWVDIRSDGDHMGYQSIRMRPVDLLKVGQVMLNGGVWNGEQYLPAAYIDELTTAPAPKANPSYGLFWHLNSGDFFLTYAESDRVEGNLMPGTPEDAVANYGSRGQLIVAIPSLDLAWVRTGPDISSSIWAKDSIVTKLSNAIVAAVTDKTADHEWRSYGGNEQGHQYSPVAQINRSNVGNLEVAWTHNHGDMERDGYKMIAYETTPLTFEGRLYLTTPFGRIVAIDAETGKDLWSFIPDYDIKQALKGWAINRGVALKLDGNNATLYVAPIDGRIYSVDARTGKSNRSFGDHGAVDTFAALDWSHLGERSAYSYTMPPTLYRNLVIVGSQIADSPQITRPPGAVLAFDADDGQLVWSFYTIPRRGEAGSETWLENSRELAGSSNVWTKLAVDEERGLLYAPTSTPNSDFYGGHRPGDNLYAETLLCLDANTGKLKWHFQTVHHGLWDYDINSQPTLVDIEIDGREIPVVAQLSKTGFCYLFNRVTGEPVWPIEERAVPASDIPGEWASPTQPFPTKPPALSQQGYSKDDLANLEPEHRKRALKAFEQYNTGPLFTPPSKKGTLAAPGYQGGSSWGGGAFDPNTNYLITNVNNMAVVFKMRKAPKDSPLRYLPRGNRFMDPDTGVPFTKPPWGKLVAVDLSKGEIAWDVPLGFDPDVAKLGLDPNGTGSFNRGGPIVTAGGLVFMGGTEDGYFRAFDSSNGDLLWEYKLPFFAPTVPITYTVNGKQYVVISAGGHSRMHTEFDEKTNAALGDALIAFALPD